MQIAIAWIVAAVVFGVADFVWLSSMSERLYRPMIGAVMADKASLAPALVFYVIYLSGIVFFAVAPALQRESWTWALLAGAALGFVAYATYDLSNQATLRVWDVRLTLIDMAWGTFATALAATASYLVASRITGSS